MKNLVYADLDTIVFEGRHQEYGAYQMRKRYNRYLLRAVLVTFLAFIALTGFPKFMSWIMPAETVVKKEVEKIILVDAYTIPLPPEEDIPEVAPPPPPAPPVIRTLAYLVPNPTPDDLVADSATIADIDAVDSSVVALVDQDGIDPGDSIYDFTQIDGPKGPDVVTVIGETDPKSDAFVLLEKEPMAVNMEELQRMIGYPALAKEAEIEGRVILRVMIDKNGDYVKHIVLKDPHPILTQAVANKINHLKMTPGVQAGRPIKVWVTIPFNFSLLR